MARFQPGKSGNPGGRPVGKSLTSKLRAALDRPENDGRSRSDVLAESLILLAIGGDFRAIELIFNRVDGKIPDAMPETGDDAPPPRRIEVLYADARWDDGEPPAFSLDDYERN